MAQIIKFPFGSRRALYDKGLPLKSERSAPVWINDREARELEAALAKIAEEMRG
jgi:hypothetical protein